MVVCAEVPNNLKGPHVGHCPCEKIRKIVGWVRKLQMPTPPKQNILCSAIIDIKWVPPPEYREHAGHPADQVLPTMLYATLRGSCSCTRKPTNLHLHFSNLCLHAFGLSH